MIQLSPLSKYLLSTEAEEEYKKKIVDGHDLLRRPQKWTSVESWWTDDVVCRFGENESNEERRHDDGD